MFEIKCIVADKRLADTLHALQKLTLEPPVIIPAQSPETILPINALHHGNPKMIRSGKPIPGAKDRIFQFVDKLAEKGTKTVTTKELKNFLIESGYAKNSYSYGLGLLVKAKKLKSSKLPNTYEVV